MSYSETSVLKALASVKDPLSKTDIVSAGRLSDLAFERGRLRVILALPAETTQDQGVALRDQAEQVLQGLPGIDAVAVLLTTHRAAPSVKTPPRRADRNPHPNKRPDGYQGDAKVARTLAISSAKGGVGKSTVTIGIARALVTKGYKVGVLDADIHGPSIPRLLDSSEQRNAHRVNGRRLIDPLVTDGLKAISIGLLTGNDDPVVWRGPMVQGAIARMLWDTDWGELDLLLIDMPPGTGDPQLGLAKDIKPNGAIIVTTPQDLALQDARKGVSMFAKVDIKVLGWVENMAVFTCPACGTDHRIFGEGDLGLNVPKLASLPLSMDMREAKQGFEALADAVLSVLP